MIVRNVGINIGKTIVPKKSLYKLLNSSTNLRLPVTRWALTFNRLNPYHYIALTGKPRAPVLAWSHRLALPHPASSARLS